MHGVHLGITGHSGTGKTTIANYLARKYSFEVYEGSSIIAAHARSSGLQLKERGDYAAHHRVMQQSLGSACLSKVFLDQEADRAVFCGVRVPANLAKQKEAGGVILGLVCPPKVCVERLDTTDPKNASSVDEYFAQIQNETGADENSINVNWCIQESDHIIDTSQPLDASLIIIDSIVEPLLARR